MPACGEKVKAGVAVCKHCRAILDKEKASQHGFGPGTKVRDCQRVGEIGGKAAENKTAPEKGSPSAGAALKKEGS